MYIGYSDGGSRNSGAACAWIITKDDETIYSDSMYLGKVSNNVAEYYGVIMLLVSSKTLKIKEITVIQDSELVSRQITGQYKVKAQHLIPLNLMAQDLIKYFDKISFQTVSRETKRIRECDAYCTLKIKHLS